MSISVLKNVTVVRVAIGNSNTNTEVSSTWKFITRHLEGA